MASDQVVPPADNDEARPKSGEQKSAPNATNETQPLVSVIVPAYNAARWIDATLRSLRSQTYRDIEVIVVDDGSRDRTAQIVDEHIARDSRVSLISQPNAGVAAARNFGIAKARGKYIAPTDADDLSAPTRIAALVAALELALPTTAVAYSWSAFLDEQGNTMATPLQPDFANDVRQPLYESNFVGNGSAALIRADALRQVGGYDTTLRDHNAQGCEDWAILLLLAEHYHFALIPEYLMGYRQSPANMSSDMSQMLRSFDLVATNHAKRYPHAGPALRQARKAIRAGALTSAIGRRQPASVMRLAAGLAMTSPRWAWNILSAGLHSEGTWRANAPAFANMIDAADRRPFVIGDPDCE